MIEILGKQYSTYDFEEIKGKHYGFIYVTVNNTNGKMYVGLHFRWDKTYLGSGKILLNAIKREGRKNFTRHIIDVADSYEDLVALEHYYITKAFGVNCSESRLFYNIYDKEHKSGSMSWDYLTDEERADRIARSTKKLRETLAKRTPEQIKETSEKRRRIALLNYKRNPKLRDTISKRTSEGMTPEVRKHLSEIKKGVTPKISEEERIRRAERMRKVGKKKTIPWNKGKSTKELVGDKMSLGHRKYYSVLLNGEVIIPELTNQGGYQAMADSIGQYFGGKPIGKKNVQTLIKTGEPYVAQVSHKKYMEGLQILKKEGNEKRTHD